MVMLLLWYRVGRASSPAIRAACLLGLLLVVPCTAAAQVLHGQVVDSAGTPVSVAHIHVVPDGSAAISDISGAFTLEHLPAGRYSLAILRLGFRPETVSLATPPPGSLVTIRLTAIPVPLEAVTISALEQDLPRVFDRMRRHIGAVAFGDDLRKRYPGVPLDDILKFDAALHRYGQGSKYCGKPTVFLDGVWLFAVPPQTISQWVHMQDVAAVEAYSSPELVHEPFVHYLPGACGAVILIWTYGYKQHPWGDR
jgi:Carboxypeptidase regulatory-like domain